MSPVTAQISRNVVYTNKKVARWLKRSLADLRHRGFSEADLKNAQAYETSSEQRDALARGEKITVTSLDGTPLEVSAAQLDGTIYSAPETAPQKHPPVPQPTPEQWSAMTPEQREIEQGRIRVQERERKRVIAGTLVILFLQGAAAIALGILIGTAIIAATGL